MINMLLMLVVAMMTLLLLLPPSTPPPANVRVIPSKNTVPTPTIDPSNHSHATPKPIEC